MEIRLVLVIIAIIGSFWLEARYKAKRKAKNDKIAANSNDTAFAKERIYNHPRQKAGTTSSASTRPSAALKGKPETKAENNVAEKPNVTASFRDMSAKSETKLKPTSTVKPVPTKKPVVAAKTTPSLNAANKGVQRLKSTYDLSIAQRDKNTFRSSYLLDKDHGYGAKSLWLNFLQLGYVEDCIPAIRYDVIWRASASMGDGGTCVDRVPPHICLSGDADKFTDWLLSDMIDHNPEDRDRYMHDENLQRYVSEIQEKVAGAESDVRLEQKTDS